jgi:hypothetical protein
VAHLASATAPLGGGSTIIQRAPTRGAHAEGG